jgi:protoporphyrinogen oxidase
MKVAVVGGGVLGLTLALRLVERGHAVDVIEAGERPGGLARWADYGEFSWDRFYHVIAPQDRRLTGLLGELGLAGALRWTATGTGYYARGRFHPMTTTADLLRFPLLSAADKLRLGASVLYATRLADPIALQRVSARDWLLRLCGRRTYEAFWRPLLRAKFGALHEEVAAVFIWATLKRLYAARSAGSHRERLGYVSGGYKRVLERFLDVLRARGARVRLAHPVVAIRTLRRGEAGRACELVTENGGTRAACVYDQVLFTAPSRLARRLVSADLLPHVARMERDYPSAGAYLGVACLVLALRRPLTPFYVLNVGDADVQLTGVIEMTNLVDASAETAGRTLVYLPQYADSEDPLLQEPDERLEARLLDAGLRRLFPRFSLDDVVGRWVHRERYVQALPTVRSGPPGVEGPPALESPFQLVNTSMLRCATLNNDEVVGLADDFVARNASSLHAAAAGA